ncbi:uncharacterized protein LODBEIA_P60700 [Lodderomyces beijingensis]|uniref:Tr-type G domain-containing protein n=1 Tax=Lodderomyces beijingensis TaxID=1775926 RepID=A0ABP0ZUN2_9ASCO
MDYDEDELDYQSHDEVDEFDEDKLANDEYDLMHEQLAHLKSKLKSYNPEIPEIDLKEALYFNYFELEPSIEELKAKFKPTQLAKQRAQQRELEQQQQQLEDGNIQKNERNEGSDGLSTPGKPLSKLAALARSRSRQAPPSDRRHSILDQFTSGVPSSAASSLSKSTPSILNRKRTERAPVDTSTASQLEQEQKKLKVPAISYDIQVDNSMMTISAPSEGVSVFWFPDRSLVPASENEQKRRRLYNSLFEPITNFDIPTEKISASKESFIKPSPDDQVLNAQKQAFEGVGKLQINEQSQNNNKPTAKEKNPKLKDTKPFKKIDVAREIATNPSYAKPHKSFVVIGHVDAGKSTLMGRLLFDFGIVDAKTVNKLVKESERLGKGSFALAWIMDQTEEERSHGVTVDICATDFEIESTKFTAIDAPGHKDFVPQMVSGVSNADFALLVVDSITGEFEAGFALDGQTKEHTILAKNLGVEKICVVVNKMDKEDWSQDRYEAIKEQMMEYMTSPDVDFKPEQIDFVPISGLTGDNVVKRNASATTSTPMKFDWYKGPTLGQYLEQVSLDSQPSRDQIHAEPFYLSVSDVYKDKGELKVIGKINSGCIQSGETVIAYPSEESLQVQSIKVAQTAVDFAISGQLVTLHFKTSQLSNEAVDPIRVGDVVAKTVASPISSVKKFTASLHLFNMDKPLLVGMPFVLFRNSTQAAARISRIVEITTNSSMTKQKKKKNILHLTSKQTAIVEIEVDGGESLPLTTYKDNAKLGRIVIRRQGSTIGAGQVLSLE